MEAAQSVLTIMEKIESYKSKHLQNTFVETSENQVTARSGQSLPWMLSDNISNPRFN